MPSVNIKKELSGEVEKIIPLLTQALQKEGFGILTRIDFHLKIKEKLGKDLPPTVILGACNPQLAFEAYQMNSDVTSLLPCNAVVREVGPHKISVELALPSAMMIPLGDPILVDLARSADEKLQRVLDSLALSL
ncbi:DUF302 domain-containing protein [Bdellovibrionota bacterium FG-2]